MHSQVIPSILAPTQPRQTRSGKNHSAPPVQNDAWARLLGISPSPTPRPTSASQQPDRRPRRLTAEACSTDNLLSHSIEYLVDARQIPSGRVTDLAQEEPDVQAVRILMEARHQVYLDCPVIERRSPFGMLGMFKGPERRRQ